jgi:iron-sulfur cluster repair protein YtfE (RIC family)
VSSLLSLCDVHVGLKELLALHRDLVVGLEWRKALEALGRFAGELRAHMDFEERRILPLYAQRVGPAPGGDPEFFRLEHRNLLKNLEDVKGALAALVGDPKAGRRQAHELLEKESMLLHLLEHHDLREKNILYPRLDSVVTEEERAALLREGLFAQPPSAGGV